MPRMTAKASYLKTSFSYLSDDLMGWNCYFFLLICKANVVNLMKIPSLEMPLFEGKIPDIYNL